MEQNYTRIDHELPLIPLRGLAIFPYMILNFDIGREMSLKALDQAMMEDELVFLTSQIEAEVDEPTTEDFYHVGTICKVKQVIKLPGETVRVLVEGISRGKVKEINEDEGYFKASVEEIIYDQENAGRDASRVCNLHHSSWQHWILNPLSKDRNRTPNLMVPIQIH